MKYILSTFLIFFALLLSAQTDTLKFSMDIWPPFTNGQNEKSLATDIVRTALDRVNIPSAYEIDNFDAVLEGIYSGAFDGSPALWKSAEREEHLLFSDPYLENQMILVGRKGADVSQSSFSQLEQQRIGLVKDYAYGDSVTKIIDADIVYGRDDQENLVNLLSEKIDYMLVDALLMQYLLKYELNDVSALLEFAAQPLIVKPLHLAIRKDHPEAENLVGQFNEQIREMMAEGVYNELLGLDWIRADINGDGIMEIVITGEAAGTEAPDQAYDVYYSDASNTDQYYIGGQYYSSWDDVPDKYKVKVPPPEGLDAYDFGMTIKF